MKPGYDDEEYFNEDDDEGIPNGDDDDECDDQHGDNFVNIIVNEPEYLQAMHQAMFEHGP